MSWKSSCSLRLSNIIKIFFLYSFCESSVDFAIFATQLQHMHGLNTLLDISVISAVIYCISPSIILQTPSTVNNCNTLCIMGIFCDVRPHIQRLTVFF